MDVPGAFANNNKYNLKEWKIGCNLKINKGEKWIFKGIIRIWSGTRWHCQHNKRKSRCTTCGGGEICKHKKRREQCIQCGGASICEHKKQRSQCIQCGGSKICEHKKQRSQCIQCLSLIHI